MLFISAEDFFDRAAEMHRMTREEEKCCAQKMAQGDTDARERLILSYYPHAASYVRRLPKELQNLRAVYSFIAALEKGVDSFDFLQDRETFAHHLSWRMRQCLTRCIAER